MTSDEAVERIRAAIERAMREPVDGCGTTRGRAAHVAAAVYREIGGDLELGTPADLEPVDAMIVERGSQPLGAGGRRWATIALYVDGAEETRFHALMVGPVVGERFKLRLIDRIDV